MDRALKSGEAAVGLTMSMTWEGGFSGMSDSFRAVGTTTTKDRFQDGTKCAGETGRWRRMLLLKKYMSLGVREIFDNGVDEDTPEVSPVMHQTCHQWAFEVRQNVLDQFWHSGK